MTKSIFITGSSRGIGKSIALRLARDGFDIVLHCRQQFEQAQQVAQTIQTLGRNVRVLQFDVSDPIATSEILLDDIANHGCYYGVVCNAGITRDGLFAMMKQEHWYNVIQTNLDSFYHVLNPLIMPMIERQRPGRIVTIASTSGQIGNGGQVNYSAAKSGLIGATKALALELARLNITVNCVAPGLIETDMTQQLNLKEITKLIPMRRIGTSEEVAAAVSFLMSEDASYITRQVLAVNGGLI